MSLFGKRMSDGMNCLLKHQNLSATNCAMLWVDSARVFLRFPWSGIRRLHNFKSCSQILRYRDG